MAQTISSRYINLERSVERRELTETRLKKLGLLPYFSRYNAVDGKNLNPTAGMMASEIACFYSHYHALESAEDTDFVHIIEDDLMISDAMPSFYYALTQSMLAQHWDVIFTESHIYNDDLSRIIALNEIYRKNQSPKSNQTTAFSTHNLRHADHTGMTSYIVSREGRNKLLALYQEEIKKGPRMPVDFFIRWKCDEGKINMAGVVPFLTLPKLGMASDIAGGAAPEYADHGALLRHIFYADGITEEAKKLLPQLPHSGFKSFLQLLLQMPSLEINRLVESAYSQQEHNSQQENERLAFAADVLRTLTSKPATSEVMTVIINNNDQP